MKSATLISTIFFLVLILFSFISLPSDATEIAVTIDDLPIHGELPINTTRLEVAQKFLSTLNKHHLKGVYGFVNAERIDKAPDGEAVLKAWVDEGQSLGNHSFSHMSLNQHSAQEFEEDIIKNESALKNVFPQGDFLWFRFPFLHEGPTKEKRDAIRAFLKTRNYRIAQVTLNFGDWRWQNAFARCQDLGQQTEVSNLKRSNLKDALAVLRYNKELSKKLFHREIKFILLIHVGAFTGQMLDEVLTAYESQGARFISLAEATEDAAYEFNPDYISDGESTFLEQIRKVRHIAQPPIVDFERPQFEKLCQ